MTEESPGRLALDGVRVLDLTAEVAGPYCTLLLAGLGADVVKVEPPGGESGRRVPPFAGDRAEAETGLRFLHLNRGKRGVVLDPDREGDRSMLRELAAGADVVIVDGAAGPALARWGVTVEELRALRPGLVVTSLPPFASGGPLEGWAATELIVAAASGQAACTGEPDRSPLKTGGYLCLVAQGQTAAAATLAALLAARRGGAGTDVEVAATDANAEMLGMWTGGRDLPMTRRGRLHQLNYPWHCYRTRDGWVGVHAGPGNWRDFVEMIGAPELGEYASMPARAEARDQIDRAIERWLSTVGKREAYHAGQARRFGFGYVASAEDLLHSPQLEARGFFRSIEHPAAPGAAYPGPPFRLASGWRDARAPLLGEHTEQVLAEPARPRHRAVATAAEAPASGSAQPLAGVRVLDLTQIWAGPRATMVLSDYGAEVIKIESPGRTDGARGYARYRAALDAGEIASEREHNRRGGFEHLHRGERSVTLDLRSEVGQRAFRQMVAVSDVVIANFAYGVLARLHAAWEDLTPLNPRIIVVSMTGFGDSGPERDYVGYGVSQEELSGIYAITGYEDGEPLKSGTNIGDPMNGMHGVVAILAALLERERTGRGQYVEMSQLESAVGFIGESILDFAVNARTGRPAGNSDPRWAPHGIYPARGEDRWVALVARDEGEWAALLDVLDAGDLGGDARFARSGDRLTHRAALDEALASLTVTRDRDDLASALQARGVPAAPVLRSDEVQAHPQYRATGFVQTMAHPDGGEYTYFGPMWRIDGARPPLRGPAPLLGEHNAEVLGDLTTLSAEEIAAVSG